MMNWMSHPKLPLVNFVNCPAATKAALLDTERLIEQEEMRSLWPPRE